MAEPFTPSAYGSIGVAPPNVGPEPPGLAAGVAKLFGAPEQPPDPYALTDQQLIDELAATRKLCEPGREMFEFGWWRLLLYDLGRHWIYWNQSSRNWEDKRLAKWIPKPVTNKIRETRMAIQALTADIVPGVNCRPNGRGPRNITTAETADDLAPLIHQEHEMDANLWDADYWAIMLGNAFFHPFWDTTKGAMQDVQLDQCMVCKQVFSPEQIVAAHQRCPNCKSANLRPALNPDGTPAVESAMIGRGQTLVLSPLQLLMPLHCAKFEQVDRLIHLAWEPRHVVEEMLSNDAEGTALAKKIQWTSGPEYRGMQLYRSLSSMADVPFAPSSFSTGGTYGENVGATVQAHWIKPCRKYPQGLFMKFIGDGQPIPVRSAQTGAIPYQTSKGEAIWPWAHEEYSHVGGRLYAQGAVDIIITKNDSINRIDSMNELSMQRMGNPVWLEPKGAEVERFTGEPGLIVKWQPIGQTGAKPERIPGENIPASAFTLRQQHLADIEDETGAYDVFKGQKPSGVEAYSALNLLDERSRSRFSPFLKNRGKVYRNWYEIALELERSYGPDIRVRESRTPAGGWTFDEFKKADLTGMITIVIEDGSNAPKTALGKRANIQQLQTLMLLDPNSTEQRYAIFQELGALELAPGLDADVKSALREQYLWEQWFDKNMQGVPPLVRYPWDNDQVHLSENRKWMNSDAVMDRIKKLPLPLQGPIILMLGNHLMEHASQLVQQAPAGGAPGAGPTPGTGGPAGPPSGAGTPSGTQAAPGGSPLAHSQSESTRRATSTPAAGVEPGKN